VSCDYEREQMSAYGQCGECNEPDRVAFLPRGLCVRCERKLEEDS
jgi:hypothetical protein